MVCGFENDGMWDEMYGIWERRKCKFVNFSGKFRVTTICVDESTGEIVYHHQECSDHRPDFSEYSAAGEIPASEEDYHNHITSYEEAPILFGKDFELAYDEYERGMGWEHEVYDDSRPQKRDSERINKINEYCRLEYGEFAWVKLPVSGPLFIDKDPAVLARAFFIGTNMTNGDFSMDDLGLASTQRINVKKISESGLFIGKVNRKNFDGSVMWRGKIGKETLKTIWGGGCRVRRLYLDQYKSTYQNTPATKHTHLGRLVQLLPYVHKFYGVFCRQEDAESINGVHPLSFCDMADAIGIGKNHSDRLRENLLSLTYTRKGRSWPVMYEAKFGGETAIVLSPKFMYGGSMIDRDDLMVPAMWQGG